MGISRDHLEKIELKLKTERGWREGLTVNSACGPSGDTNFTPPYSLFVVSQQLAAPASVALECPPPPKKKKKATGAFSADQREATVLVFLCRDESAGVCTVVPSLEL